MGRPTLIFLESCSINHHQPAEIEPADNPLEVDTSKPARLEIKKVIKHAKVRKAPGLDGVPQEAVKADLDISTEMFYALFEKVWNTEELSNKWKQGHLIKLAKKRNLQECKNWCELCCC